MLLAQGIIFFVFFVGTVICSDEKIDNDNELHDSELHCAIICLGSGGDGEFDPKNQTCKCSNNTDGAERELMAKNAKAHNVTLEKSEIRKKRETDSNSERVGQQLPRIPSRNRQSTLRPAFGMSSTRRPLRSSTRSPITFPAFGTTKRTSHLSTRHPTRILPNLGGDAQKRIQEIQQRINDQLRNRARNVPNFQQRANNGDQSAAKVLEQIRQRQKELQERLRSAINSENANGRIGASLGQEGDVQVKPRKAHRSKSESNKGAQQEIITQPSELYDNN